MPASELLRVGMFSPYSLSVPGGVQMQVMGLARTMRAMGIEVRVLGPCDGPPPATFVTPLGNSLPTAANGSMAPLAPDPAAALRTIRALIDEQFDIIHLHEPYVPGPTMTALVLHPAPVVATFHAAGTSSSYQLLNAPLKSWSKNITYQAAVSKDALALVSASIPGEYDTVFNGVELHRFADAAPHPTTGPTIFFCGRHEERKGLDVLLRAMTLLAPDVRLWVGGTGPDSGRLREEFAGDPRIEWLGRLTDEDKFSRLQAADVFCAPSLHGESFGVVLIEAMAAGAAVVASGLDGYRNVATHDVNALLVEPGDVAALSDALRTVLGDARLRDRLVAAGHARAEHFSMVRLAEHYIDVYRRIALPHRAASTWRLSVSLWQERMRRMLGG
jgi:phosphatidylinositol alpha-mannosyltransferase